MCLPYHSLLKGITIPYTAFEKILVLLYSVLANKDEGIGKCFSLDLTSFKRKWPISRKLQKGSKEWVTFISLYHTRKQPRIKNLLSWDYPLNFPPSFMKGFCLPADNVVQIHSTSSTHCHHCCTLIQGR